MHRAFEYVEKNTIVHRLNPMSKMLFVMLTLILVLVSTSFPDILPLIVWLGLTLTLWAVAKVEIRSYLSVLRIIGGIAIFFIIVQGFMYRGRTPLLVLGHLEIWGGADLGVVTLEGLLFGIMIAVRVLTAVTALPLFVMTTPISKLSAVLAKTKMPPQLNFMFVSGLRFAPLIFEIWNNIVEAQKLRAFDIDKMNIFQKARRAYIPIITPLVLLLFKRGNDMQIALESRGFGYARQRTYIEKAEFHASDYFFITSTLAFFSVLLLIKFGVIPIPNPLRAFA